jgi:hypothetical protein
MIFSTERFCPVAVIFNSIRRMPDRTYVRQVVVLAEPEPVLHLPKGKAGFDDIPCQPIRIVGNNVFTGAWPVFRLTG